MAKAEPIHGLDPEAPLAVNAALIVGTRLNEMLAFAPYLTDAESVYELHQMRIAAKRLRYTMELFQEVYTPHPDFAARFSAGLETVKALQDHLGFLHDADVLVPQLTAHLTHLLKDSFGTDHRDEPVVGVHFVDFDAGIGLLTLCRETRVERDARYAKFLTDWTQWQEQELFAHLTALLEEAAQAALSPEPPVAPPVPDVPVPTAQEGIAAHAENRIELDKPIRRDASRRRRPLEPRRAPASGRHSRTGADTPARDPEGGTENLAALRNASLETLLAVPGLTEIKARHIQTFLAPFKNLPTTEPAPAGKSASSSLVQWETPPAVAPVLSPLAEEAVRALGHTTRFLLGIHAPQFRNRLLRELTRFAERAETLSLEPSDLQADALEQQMRQLRRGGEEFVAADAQPELDRKAQSKLADTLAEINIALGAPPEPEHGKEKEKSK